MSKKKSFFKVHYSGNTIRTDYRCGGLQITRGDCVDMERDEARELVKLLPNDFSIVSGVIMKEDVVVQPDDSFKKNEQEKIEDKPKVRREDPRKVGYIYFEPEKYSTYTPEYLTEKGVSFVTGTFNRLAGLKRMMDSVRKQTNVPYEFVVVDGGSNDGTRDWLRSQEDVTLICEPYLRGAIAAFNNGFYKARGKYVVNLNDDIIVNEGTINAAFAHLEQNEDVGQVAFWRTTVDMSGNVKRKHVVDRAGFNEKSTIYANFGMARKVLGDKVGWWGEDAYTYGGDTECSLKIFLEGYKIATVDGCEVTDYQFDDEIRKTNYELYTARYEHGQVHSDTMRYSLKWRNIICDERYKIHVGCGDKILPRYKEAHGGWINIDVDGNNKPDFVCDVRNLVMIPSGHCDEVYSCHCLEHFYESETIDVLKEWVRPLKKGGILRIATVDIEKVVKHRIKKNDDGNNFNVAIFGRIQPEIDPKLYDMHKQVFTKDTLIALMEEAGLKNIKTWKPDGEIKELNDYSGSLVSINLVGEKK